MVDARALTQKLGGRWHGRYGLACCPAHEDTNPSMTVAEGRNGRLLLHCKAGCEFREVVSAMLKRGLWDRQSRPHPPSPSEIARRHAQDEADAVKREQQARAVWSECRTIHGTLAEAYLRTRGISCTLPESLRFHPACWHASAKRLPALVARVDGLERVAVHRTYLNADGSSKADVNPNKAMLGRTVGGAVRVHDAAGPLVVAEGIETALSLTSGMLSTPSAVWAALSASGMSRLLLPEDPHRLLIAADGDAAGMAAAEALARRAAALGWSVELKSAPEGLDFNDVLLEGRKPSWR